MKRAPLLAVLIAVVVAMAVPAAAMSARETGELVEYALEFPVAGSPWYYDSFGEPRPNDRTHAGIDLFADKGVEVRAVATGTILRVNGSYDSLAPERCCSMVILHDDGWQSVYAHLNNDSPGTDDGKGWGIAPDLAPGRRVSAGQLIGWVGDSGNAEDTPPHLHFELHDPAGVIVNPVKALQASKAGPVATSGPATRFSGDTALVKRIQENLTRVGIDVGGVDGRYGRLTEGAVVEFQQRTGLETDGVAGPVTRAALAGMIHAQTGSLLGFGRKGDEVATVQKQLAAAGLDPGPADGSFGPVTLQAVLSFQKARSLAVDGLIGPETRAALGGSN